MYNWHQIERDRERERESEESSFDLELEFEYNKSPVLKVFLVAECMA